MDQKHSLSDFQKKEIQEEKDPQKVYNLVKTYLPGWIVRECKQCAVDLQKMNFEWAAMCVQLGVEPRLILLVNNTYIQERLNNLRVPEHEAIYFACDQLSRVGYFVRDDAIFSICRQCKELIVSEEVVTRAGVQYTGFCVDCLKTHGLGYLTVTEDEYEERKNKSKAKQI